MKELHSPKLSNLLHANLSANRCGSLRKIVYPIYYQRLSRLFFFLLLFFDIFACFWKLFATFDRRFLKTKDFLANLCVHSPNCLSHATVVCWPPWPVSNSGTTLIFDRREQENGKSLPEKSPLFCRGDESKGNTFFWEAAGVSNWCWPTGLMTLSNWISCFRSSGNMSQVAGRPRAGRSWRQGWSSADVQLRFGGWRIVFPQVVQGGTWVLQIHARKCSAHPNISRWWHPPGSM